MTSTGIVRRIDSVGRFVLPIELRRTLQIEDNDSLEIFVEDNTIVLKKYQPACIFCGNARDVSTYKGKNVCTECIDTLQTIK
ncbi:MAG: AbrB/MazE/SpoVT family DNA-binding domain-containing protein [Clostridia bacterium]|nr:AbrB/MazE/SpoVT family DNA-binding domain-containing protein [Clostridia bacterium]